MLPAIEAVEAATLSRTPTPSTEARLVLDSVFARRTFSGEAFTRKLKLLAGNDRAFVLDELMRKLNESEASEALMSLATIEPESEEALLLLERAVRQATLDGASAVSGHILQFASCEVFGKVAEGLREAFFQNVVDIMQRNQFEDVNVITPAVIRVQDAIPLALRRSYVEALLEQSHSDAWKGGPAARRAIRDLPIELRDELFDALDAKALWQRFNSRTIRDLLKYSETKWPVGKQDLFADYLTLKMFDFAAKQFPDEE